MFIKYFTYNTKQKTDFKASQECKRRNMDLKSRNQLEYLFVTVINMLQVITDILNTILQEVP